LLPDTQNRLNCGHTCPDLREVLSFVMFAGGGTGKVIAWYMHVIAARMDHRAVVSGGYRDLGPVRK
jgi:hypothetical protein